MRVAESKIVYFRIEKFVSLQRTTTEWLSNRTCAKHVRSKLKHAYLKFSVVNAVITQIWSFTFTSFWGTRTRTAFHILQGLSSIHEGHILFAIYLNRLCLLNVIATYEHSLYFVRMQWSNRHYQGLFDKSCSQK